MGGGRVQETKLDMTRVGWGMASVEDKTGVWKKGNATGQFGFICG